MLNYFFGLNYSPITFITFVFVLSKKQAKKSFRFAEKKIYYKEFATFSTNLTNNDEVYKHDTTATAGTVVAV